MLLEGNGQVRGVLAPWASNPSSHYGHASLSRSGSIFPATRQAANRQTLRTWRVTRKISSLPLTAGIEIEALVYGFLVPTKTIIRGGRGLTLANAIQVDLTKVTHWYIIPMGDE